MSKYSEVIGSFIRMGNFPLEANYVFETEEALKNFYKDEVLKATLHKGLLKVVANSTTGELSLWWVTKKQTNDGLKFVKLISYTDIDDLNSKLNDLEAKINLEIADRKEADDAIWGTVNHNEVPDNLNSLLDLSLAIISLKEDLNNYKEQTNEKLQTLLDYCKAIAGSPIDEIPSYLETLDYKNLTTISLDLNKFLNTFDEEDNKINTLPEIQEFLHGYTDTDKLHNLLEDLWHRIEGDPMPSELFRTLRGIEDYILVFVNRVHNLQTELDLTQVGVGLSGDGSYNADQETYYLRTATSVMNALKILDGLINEAINNCNIEAVDTNTIDISVDKYANKTTISANVLISTDSGNSIIAKSNGLYHKVSSTYDNGILTLYVNDTIVAQHVLGLAYVGISEAKYDSLNEELVIVFRKEDGTTEELRISAASLIREWVVDNTGVSDVVVLTRTEVFGGGPDKLSADVRLLDDKYNILTKSGNLLYVKGTADNIVWNDVKVSVILDNLKSDLLQLSDSVGDLLIDLNALIVEVRDDLQEKLDREVLRAELAESEIRTDYNSKIEVLKNRIDSIQDLTNQNSAAITTLGNNLTDETKRALEAEAAITVRVTDEITRATAAEQDLLTKINTNASNISVNSQKIDNEIARSLEQDNELSNKINEEVARATALELALLNSLNLEIERAKNAENTIDLKVFVNSNEIVKIADKADKATLAVTEFESELTSLDSKIESEITTARTNEAILDHKIEDETNRAKAAEQTILDRLHGLSDLGSHLLDYTNPHRVTKDLVGLDKVENLAPMEMPVSTAVLTALDDKADLSLLNWNEA